MGNPGKEGPKVGKQLWQLWNCFSERSSSLSAQHEAVELRPRFMRFFLCTTFNPQRQNTFQKISIWIISQGPSAIPTSHYVLCGATVCARSGCCCYGYSVSPQWQGECGAKRTRHFSVCTEQGAVKGRFFFFQFMLKNFFFVLSFRELKESEDSQARWETKVMRWVESWIKIKSHISFKPSCQIWWRGFSSLLHVWHYMSV